MRSPDRTKTAQMQRNATKKKSTKDDERQYLKCANKGPRIEQNKTKRKHSYALPRLLTPQPKPLKPTEKQNFISTPTQSGSYMTITTVVKAR